MKIVLKRVVVKKETHDRGDRLLDDQAEGLLALQGPDQGRHARQGRRARPSSARSTYVDGKMTTTKVLSQQGHSRSRSTAVVKVGTKARPAHRRSAPAPRRRQHLRRRHQPRQRRDVGPDRPVRVRWQLAHQHRQRLLRRPAVRDRARGSPTVATTSPRAPTSRRAPSRSPSPTATTPRPASRPGAARTPPDPRAATDRETPTTRGPLRGLGRGCSGTGSSSEASRG